MVWCRFFFVCLKFHLFLWLPLLLVGQRRWRMLAGLSVGGLSLLVLSFVVAGGRWPLDYYAVLTDSKISPAPDLMINFHGLFYGLPGSFALEIACGAAVAVATFWGVRRASLLEGLAIVLTGGLLTSYHGYTGDCLLLLPAGLVVTATMTNRWTVPLATLLLTPPLYLVLLSGVSPWMTPLVIILFFCSIVMLVARRHPSSFTFPQSEAA